MYRILLVDDEPIFLEFMKTIAEWERYDCRIEGVAEDGVSALSLIQEIKPDIVFIDISMPRMDGLEVCRWVKNQALPSKLVIMTGHDEFSFAYQAIKLGIDDFLLKPFSKEELEKCLQKMIESIQNQSSPTDAAADRENTFHQMTDGSTKYEIMSQMIDEYLNKNYSNAGLTLSTLSADLNFDSSYLRRVYKLTRGITITQKLEMLRIEEAKRLLKSGRYLGQEISSLIGFSDQYYFSKRFKQLTGKTPSEYKASDNKPG